MSAIPITQLPEINVTDPNALLVIVTSGTTYKIPFSSLVSTLVTNVEEFYLPVLSSNTTYVSSQIFQTSSGDVRVKGLGPTDLGTDELFGVHGGETDSYLTISSSANIEAPLATTIQNMNSGNTASTDIVAIGDTGNFESGYIDMGVNSSTYSGFTGFTALGGPSDAYLFSTANDLYIGNASANKRLVLFNGGFNTSENSVFYVHEDKSITINTDYLDPLNPSALKIVNANAESTSMIRTESNINDFAEINSVNKNSGDTASSDVVATNDLGDTDETQGYVNMGINSTTFNQVGEVGAAGDGYMFSTGNDLYIGNATPGKKLVLFNGGSDTTAYAKFFIHEDAAITINTALVDTDNPAAIRIVNANGTTRMIHSDGYIDDYSEIENVNASPGNSASADIVAANNLGDTDSTQGYVDMGINSTTYNVPNNIGGPNDAYVYGTGNSFYIGNASENSISNTYIFTNGKNNDAVRIAVRADGTIGFHNFLPDYPVDISGTTRVQDGNFIVSNGQTNLGVVIEAQNNADAVLSGLTIGDVYRTGDFLKIVH